MPLKFNDVASFRRHLKGSSNTSAMIIASRQFDRKRHRAEAVKRVIEIAGEHNVSVPPDMTPAEQDTYARDLARKVLDSRKPEAHVMVKPAANGKTSQ